MYDMYVAKFLGETNKINKNLKKNNYFSRARFMCDAISLI